MICLGPRLFLSARTPLSGLHRPVFRSGALLGTSGAHQIHLGALLQPLDTRIRQQTPKSALSSASGTESGGSASDSAGGPPGDGSAEELGAGDLGADKDTYKWHTGSWVQEKPWPVPQEELDSMPTRIHAICHQILQLDMIDHNRMMQYVAFHTGGVMTPAFSGGGGGGAAGGAAAAADGEKAEKTAFNVVMKGFDAKAKIKLIKEVRGLLGLGLKEAKAVVESCPQVLGKDLAKEAAEELKTKLTDLGADVEVE